MIPRIPLAVMVPQSLRSRLRAVRGGGAVGSFARNSGLVVLASGISQAAMLVAGLLVANFLGVSDFARYSILTTTLMTAATLSQAALGLTLNREVSRALGADPNRIGQAITVAYGLTLLLSTLVAGLGVAGGAPLADQMFGAADYAGGLAIASVALPFAALALVQAQLFVGLGESVRQMRLAIVSAGVTLSLPPLGAILGGWMGALAGIAAVHAVRLLAGQVILQPIMQRDGAGFLAAGWKGRVLPMLRFAAPMLASGTGALLALWWANTFLLRQSGEIALGLFAAAFMIRTILTFAPMQASTVLFAHLSRRDAQGAGPAVRKVLRGALLMTGAAGAVALVLAAFPEVILSLFGAGFRTGAPILRIMLVATVIEIALALVYQLVLASGSPWHAFAGISVPRDLTLVGLTLVLVPELGGVGLALAFAAAQAASLLGALFLLLRQLRGAAG